MLSIICIHIYRNLFSVIQIPKTWIRKELIIFQDLVFSPITLWIEKREKEKENENSTNYENSPQG